VPSPLWLWHQLIDYCHCFVLFWDNDNNAATFVAKVTIFPSCSGSTASAVILAVLFQMWSCSGGTAAENFCMQQKILKTINLPQYS